MWSSVLVLYKIAYKRCFKCQTNPTIMSINQVYSFFQSLLKISDKSNKMKIKDLLITRVLSLFLESNLLATHSDNVKKVAQIFPSYFLNTEIIHYKIEHFAKKELMISCKKNDVQKGAVITTPSRI